MDNWKPIETAKVDGSFFLGCKFKKGPTKTVYVVGKAQFCKKGYFRFVNQDGWPTHWQDLPAPPRN